MYVNHKIYHGDVWASLLAIEDSSIDGAITSPPYWGQRDYGFEGQIGNESNYKEYIAKLVTLFRLLRSKLKSMGVFYLNIGDKYLTKYGNTPLGMVPYKLVYYLVQDGWKLEDILIWYKPNHMPSSVKNRFTNTYEPIFVLTKNKINYYKTHKDKHPGSNILKIPVQSVEYKHMATYPEKLVEQLLSYSFPEEAAILDPFAGTGTTAIAVQNLNDVNGLQLSSIMIEANSDFIEIIQNRCNVPKHQIKKISYKRMEYSNFSLNFKISCSVDMNKFTIDSKTDILIKIFHTQKDFTKYLDLLYSGIIFGQLNDDGILFLGLPDNDIFHINIIAHLIDFKWIIRNMIVVKKENSWFPIFMLVKDIKSVRYKFKLNRIRVDHKSNYDFGYKATEFIGYKVSCSSILCIDYMEGLVLQISQKHPNSLPHWVIVKWNTGDYTVEEVMNKSNYNDNLYFTCPHCKNKLDEYYHYSNIVSCPTCEISLWQSTKTIPKLHEITPKSPPECEVEELEVIERSTINSNYSGKFKEAKKINKGQSPGARSSTVEQYFSMKRFYDVVQPMIADYLNIHRKEKGLSKKSLTELFPAEYKHTVGHWLRKDRGGSLPKTGDLLKLQKILELDVDYVNYISRMGLRVQTVIPDEHGKNPGDYWEYSVKGIISMLNKLKN